MTAKKKKVLVMNNVDYGHEIFDDLKSAQDYIDNIVRDYPDCYDEDSFHAYEVSKELYIELQSTPRLIITDDC